MGFKDLFKLKQGEADADNTSTATPEKSTKSKKASKSKKNYIDSMKLNPIAEDAFMGVMTRAIENEEQPYVIDDEGLTYTLGLTNDLLADSDIIKTSNLGVFKKRFDLSNRSLEAEGSITNASFSCNIDRHEVSAENAVVAMLPTWQTLDTLKGFDRSIDQSAQYVLMTIPTDLSAENIDDYQMDGRLNELVRDADGTPLLMTIAAFKDFINRRKASDDENDTIDYQKMLMQGIDDDAAKEDESKIDNALQGFADTTTSVSVNPLGEATNGLELLGIVDESDPLNDDPLSAPFNPIMDTNPLGDIDTMSPLNELLGDSLNTSSESVVSPLADENPLMSELDMTEFVDPLDDVMNPLNDLVKEPVAENPLNELNDLNTTSTPSDTAVDPFDVQPSDNFDNTTAAQINTQIEPFSTVPQPFSTTSQPFDTLQPMPSNDGEIDIEAQLRQYDLQPTDSTQTTAVSTVVDSPTYAMVQDQTTYALDQVDQAFSTITVPHFKVNPSEGESELTIQKNIYNESFVDEYERTKAFVKNKIRNQVEKALAIYYDMDAFEEAHPEIADKLKTDYLQENDIERDTNEMIATIEAEYRKDLEDYLKTVLREAKLHFDAANAPVRDALISEAGTRIREKRKLDYQNELTQSILDYQDAHTDTINADVDEILETLTNDVEGFRQQLQMRTEYANNDLITRARQLEIAAKYQPKQTTPEPKAEPIEDKPSQTELLYQQQLADRQQQIDDMARQNKELSEKMMKLMEMIATNQTAITPAVNISSNDVAPQQTPASTDSNQTSVDKTPTFKPDKQPVNKVKESAEQSQSTGSRQPQKKPFLEMVKGLFLKPRSK